MPDSDGYEHTDDDESNIKPPPKKKQKCRKGELFICEERDEHRKYFDTVEEYHSWFNMSEKERELEIFNRMEAYEDRENKERIRKQLEERRLSNEKADRKSSYSSDIYSPTEGTSPEKGNVEAPKRFEKNTNKADLMKDVFGTCSDSSSESDSGEEGEEYVPSDGEVPLSKRSGKSRGSRESASNERSSFDSIASRLVESKEDLLPARMTRSQLAQIVHTPFFCEVMKGAFVMISCGSDKNVPSDMMICEVLRVLITPKKYALENTFTDKTLEIRFGKYIQRFRLMFVSNQSWSTQTFVEYRESAAKAVVKEKQRFSPARENRGLKKARLLNALKFAEENKIHATVEKLRLELAELDKEEEAEEKTTEIKSDILRGILERGSARKVKDDENILGALLENRRIRREINERNATKKRFDFLNSDECPFTRKRARPQVISGTGTRLRQEKPEVNLPPSTPTKSPSLETAKDVCAEIDDFELYNSLTLDFTVDIGVPDVKPDIKPQFYRRTTKSTGAAPLGSMAFFARWNWLERIFSILGFRVARSIQATSTVTAPPPPSKPIVTPPVQSTPTPREMHTSAIQKIAARMPMIKFVGARLPRPNYVRGQMPSIPVSGNISTSPLVNSKASSIGSVGKIPRGQGISETQLPQRFRRPLISQEECDAINTGGSYGL